MGTRVHRSDDLRSTIEAAIAGDLDAFGRLVTRFQDMAFAIAYARLRDPSLAQYAAQEAFVDAYLHLSELRAPAAFTAWFRTIIWKHCDRNLRRRSFDLEPLDLADAIATDVPEPPDALETKRVRSRLRAAVDALPEGERVVILSTYLADQTAAEAAACLDIPLTTVKKRLHTARRRLARDLAAFVGDAFAEHIPSQRPMFLARIELFLALRCHDVARVERVLDAHPALLEADETWDVDEAVAKMLPFPFRATPLIRAAEQGDDPMVERLLARGADPDRRCGCLTNETALFAATVTDHPAIVDRLLAAGVDYEVATTGGIRPLHVAAMRGYHGLAARLLAAGADPRVPDGQGRSAADWAGLKGHDDLAALLAREPERTRRAGANAGDATRTTSRVLGCTFDADGRVAATSGPADPGPAPDANARPETRRIGPPPLVWETGIKAIDLLAPLPYCPTADACRYGGGGGAPA